MLYDITPIKLADKYTYSYIDLFVRKGSISIKRVVKGGGGGRGNRT